MQDKKEIEFIEQLCNPKTKEVAFRELIQKYQSPLYQHIRNIVLDHDDTKDVLQNTFIKIHQHIKNFKGESKLYSWIYRIATNEALTHLKQKSKRNQCSIEQVLETHIKDLETDIHFDGDEIQKKLHTALLTLPERQQQVFRMKYFQEMKYEQISEIVGISVGALKASYHLAVKKIEDFMNTH